MPIDFFQIGDGTAILIIGVLALTATVIVTMRNYIAGIPWGISVLLLMWSGAFGMPLEVFWLGMILTVVTIIAGFAVRVAV